MKYELSESTFRFISVSAITTIFSIFANSAKAVEPSFNCSGNLNPTEGAICMSDRLSRLDRKANAAYQGYKNSVGTEAARGVARKMLRKRDACDFDVECIERHIKESISVFEGNEVSLPLSTESHARAAFIALSEVDRRTVQERLQQIDLYEGQVDSLWGSGTSRALEQLTGFSIPEASNLNTAGAAISTLQFVLSEDFGTIEFNEQCDGCEEENAEAMRKAERETQLRQAAAIQRATDLSARCKSTAFTMKGICLSMSGEEIDLVLKTRGYFLVEPGHYKNEGEANVFVSEDSVRFSCESFGVCGQSLSEVGQAIVDNTTLEKLDYEQDIQNFGGTASFLEKSLCGIVDTGEKVCAMDTEIVGMNSASSDAFSSAFNNGFSSAFNSPSVTIVIERHRLGKGSVSFD